MASVSTTGGFTPRPAPTLPERAQDGGRSQASGPQSLSDAEKREVQRLRNRDREVRAHERAHLLAAGQYANGGPNYDLTRGPDGRYYATGGSVSIDTSPEPGDPQNTIDKAQQVKRAALAPSQPSGQDLQVAAQAEAMRIKAQAELRRQQLERAESGTPADGVQGPNAIGRGQQALASYRSVSAMA